MIDLDLRSSRFDKDQQKRRDEAKRKKAKELEQQKRQAKREQELAERAAQRREEMEELEIARQLAEEAEQALTGGIRFLHELKPYLIDGEDDKVILPESCLTELTQQDAFGRGALSFQLSHANHDIIKVTHCGVREFSAQKGTMGIPPKVLASFCTGDISSLSALQIKLVLLPKCTFAKLQPKHNNFIEVGPVKQCLEENLRFHTTLSVGDQLTVWYRGKAHELCVTEMKPSDRGSLVDTDVEIDLELSEEYLQHHTPTQQLQSASGELRSEGQHAVRASVVDASRTAVPAIPAVAAAGGEAVQNIFRTPVVPPVQSTEISEARSDADNSNIRSMYLSRLLPEPGIAEKEAIAIKIKFPNGQTKLRRFYHSAAVSQLFMYVAVELLHMPGVSGDVIEKLQISTRFPVRTLRIADVHSGALNDSSTGSTDGRKSFADIGLATASEAVFVALV